MRDRFRAIVEGTYSGHKDMHVPKKNPGSASVLVYSSTRVQALQDFVQASPSSAGPCASLHKLSGTLRKLAQVTRSPGPYISLHKLSGTFYKLAQALRGFVQTSLLKSLCY